MHADRSAMRMALPVKVAAIALLIAASAAPASVAQPSRSPDIAAPSTAAPSPPQASTPPMAIPSSSAPDATRANRPPGLQRLPGDVTTIQYVELPGRRLQFAATAGSIALYDANDGALQAEVAYIAYVDTSVDKARRPVTFVFNGGPGAASAYLNIGALGPWRLPFEGAVPSTPPALADNPETWLDFTDLVFIDPPGTGYSRIAAPGEGPRKQFWSVDGDAQALAVFVRKWIEKAGRQQSPKFIVGESYGGFRTPKIARALQENQGVGVNGFILISPVLDFGWRGQAKYSPWPWISALPSMAATAREAKAGFDRAALRDVEQYAAGDYLHDLLRGERDAAAVERISARVAAYTGLDASLVKRMAGRIDTGTFEREFARKDGRVLSPYDGTVTGYNPQPSAANPRYSDPILDGLTAPISSAMTELYQRKLQWRLEEPYRLLNGDIASHWDYGGSRVRGAPQVVDDIRDFLALDPRTRVMVAHGATDLVTPYFENELILEQLPVFGSADRLKFALYGGGHMFYSRDASRKALRADAEALYRAALTPAEGAPRN